MSIEKTFLQSIIKRFDFYKNLGDKTFEQLNDADFHFQLNEENNSIAIIIQHLGNNLLSRWTDFLTTDGEKEWRNRDAEFERTNYSRQQLIELWEKGWSACLDSIHSLTEDDLQKTVYIRTEPHSVVDAINRSLSHASYHVGQIVIIAKYIKNDSWKTLSIPKNKSAEFNEQLKKSM
jgi:hypothetical protein